MKSDFDVIVVGAGLVGLAIARAFAVRGASVLVLEREATFGCGISSRNSEVIHAGIYYPTGSLKHRTTLLGRRLLYEYCARRDIPHRRCGKLIVASDSDEIPRLKALFHQGIANNVEDLHWLDGAAVRKIEPELEAAAAIWSAQTGIVDSHALMLALLADIEEHHGVVAFLSPFLGAARARGRWQVEVGTPTIRVSTGKLVNSAGLAAWEVAENIRGYRDHPPKHLAKGHYFTLHGKAPFRHLIYPLPQPGGLGVHATLDLAGRVRFGPDVQWIKEASFAFTKVDINAFRSAIARYYPAIAERDLSPDYVGIRPKIVGAGEDPADFLLAGPAQHGLPGLVHCFGIESPGLTASLAIADEVARRA